MNKLLLKEQKVRISAAPPVSRDISAWQAIAGIWKKKKLQNPVAWQKSIRKEWERKLP